MTAGSHTNADEKRCKITVLLHSPAALKLFLGVLVLFFFFLLLILIAFFEFFYLQIKTVHSGRSHRAGTLLHQARGGDPGASTAARDVARL